MDKREVVEQYLSAMCAELELMHDAYAPHEPPQDEVSAILDTTDGLIAYTEYEPGTPEWEALFPEGWQWERPSDAQVEALFPVANRNDMQF